MLTLHKIIDSIVLFIVHHLFYWFKLFASFYLLICAFLFEQILFNSKFTVPIFWGFKIRKIHVGIESQNLWWNCLICGGKHYLFVWVTKFWPHPEINQSKSNHLIKWSKNKLIQLQLPLVDSRQDLYMAKSPQGYRINKPIQSRISIFFIF